MTEEAVEVPAVEEKKPQYVLLKMSDRPAYLIGQMVDEGRSEVSLYYPVLLTVYAGDDGMEVTTSKYMPFAEGESVSIVKTSIHSIATPKQNLLKHYLSFVKRWRDEGVSALFEARVLGEPTSAIVAPREQSLNDDPPTESDIKH